MGSPGADGRESTVAEHSDTAGDGRGPEALLSDLLTAKEEIEERNEALRLVNDLGLRLQRGLDLPRIAAETVDALSRCEGSPLAAFYLLEGPEGPLRLVAGSGFTERGLQLGPLLPLQGSANGLAVREQRIVRIEEVLHELGDLHPVETALSDRTVASGLCIPLTHADLPLGTMSLLFPAGRELRPVEVEAFQGIARAVSLAVANARHIANLEFLAFHDPLTGLLNRAGLHRRLGPVEAGGPARSA